MAIGHETSHQTGAAYQDLPDGAAAPVSSGGRVRLRNNGGALEASQDGAAYASLAANTPEVSNEAGDLKIQPRAQGDVVLFKDTDVDDAAHGKVLWVHRKAVEGDRWIKVHVTSGKVAYLQSNGDVYLKSGPGNYMKIEGDNVYLDLGDNAGVKKLRIRDSDKVEVAAFDSDGNLTLVGMADGRDVAADGSKLDGIESSATADQSDAEIKAAYEANADTNEFSDAEQTKLAGIETGAEVSTKEFFTPAAAGTLDNQATWDDSWIALADAGTFARCWFLLRLPADFSSMASGYPKVAFKQGTGGTGNFRIAFDTYADGVGEQLGSVIDNIAEYTMAAPGATTIFEEDVSACFDGLTLSAGDYVSLRIQRDSDDAADTFAGDLDVLGVLIKYS